jgi:hypothetical protein
MSSHALVQVFQGVTLVGAALTAGRLFRTGLRKRYPVFFYYFVFWVLNSIWPFFLSGSSHTYYWFWVCTEPIYWTFYVLVVWELCGLVLEKHPGLVTLGRWAMGLGLAFSTVISLASLIPTLRSAGAQWRTTRYFLAVEYGVTLTLVIFLLLMMFLIKGYPVRLSRNVVLHATLFTIFFISNSVGMLFQRLFGTVLYTAIDSVLMAIGAICVFIWLIFLNPAGEEVRVNLPRYSPDYEERVLYQLNALNATMLKVARR